MKIREVMKAPVIAVKPRDTVRRALKIMEKENINGTPVVDDENRLLGMIVKADIYRFLIDPGHIEDCPVEWVMTNEVVKADVEEELIDVAQRLRDHEIIALPILENDIVVGIIALEDFVDLYIKQANKQ